jgi:hypothetical protein
MSALLGFSRTPSALFPAFSAALNAPDFVLFSSFALYFTKKAPIETV